MALSQAERRQIERDEERAERNSRSRAGNLIDARTKAETNPFRKSTYAYDSLESAFPNADPGLEPFGSDVLVQIRTPRTHTSGGIALPEESRDTDQWNMQVAKVRAIGPVAFRNRETLVPWPEGAWAKLGEYVRVPKYGGDRWWVEAPEGIDGKALFVLFNDLDLKGRVPENKVLGMVAYI